MLLCRLTYYLVVALTLSSLGLYGRFSRRVARLPMVVRLRVNTNNCSVSLDVLRNVLNEDVTCFFHGRFRNSLNVLRNPPNCRNAISRIHLLCLIALLSSSDLNRRAIRRVTMVLHLMDFVVQDRPRLGRLVIDCVMRARRVNSHLLCHITVHLRNVEVNTEGGLATTIS